MTGQRFIKTVISRELDALVGKHAVARGMTNAAFTRLALANEIERRGVDEDLATMRAALVNLAQREHAAAPDAALVTVEPVLVELLHLVRLVAARADAQGQSRITNMINAQYPERKIK